MKLTKSSIPFFFLFMLLSVNLVLSVSILYSLRVYNVMSVIGCFWEPKATHKNQLHLIYSPYVVPNPSPRNARIYIHFTYKRNCEGITELLTMRVQYFLNGIRLYFREFTIKGSKYAYQEYQLKAYFDTPNPSETTTYQVEIYLVGAMP